MSVSLRTYRLLLLASLLLYKSLLFGQTASITGTIFDETTKSAIPFSNAILQGTSTGSVADLDGKFAITLIPPGTYNLIVSSVGYETKIISELVISTSKTLTIDIGLIPSTSTLNTVEVSSGRLEKSDETPLSKISIRSAEILRNPGGNRDISKVLQSFPGVASTVSFRNDIIVRGGAPNENRFYLDGIETPNINHFATQGASGGPVGMINVNFIDQVDFYAGAFPSNRGNALSSVLEFRQKNGNQERLVTTATVGSSDLGLTFDGPLGKNSNMIFSYRRSYLQFLFSALKLPFLPIYNDAQTKLNFKLNAHHTISVIGLGSYDDFELNRKVNSGESDSSVIERNEYILGYLPENDQWSYTFGVKHTYSNKSNYSYLIASRNYWQNTANKYFKNDNSDPSNLILKYSSSEAENKLRYEKYYVLKGFKISYMLGYEYAAYKNNTYNKVALPWGISEIRFNSFLDMHKGAASAQMTKAIFKNTTIINLGLRTDMNNYNQEMQNPLSQLSPRISASIRILPSFNINLSAGNYYQLPAYTVMGYRDSLNGLANQSNGLKYIGCQHYIGGVDFIPDANTKMSMEVFKKIYSNYPYLLNEQISLANLGSDFGVIGSAPVSSTSKGTSYGLEFSVQRSIKKGVYGILSYTYQYSKFTNATNTLLPSAWDNRHIGSITGGKQFKRNWEAGLKFRYISGAPYTPYDKSQSAVKANWDITQRGIADYRLINTSRIPDVHQLDIRIDKKYYFRKSSLNIYLDLQNVYSRKTQLPPYLDTEKVNQQPVEDPSDPTRYKLKEISNESGNLLPSIGVQFEF